MQSHNSATNQLSAGEPAATSVVYCCATASDGAEPDSTSPSPDEKGRGLAIQFASTAGIAFVIVGLQMSQGILLARLLGPVGRGEWATAVFYVQMLLYVGLLGGIEIICRYAARAEFPTEQLRRASLRLGLVTGGITTVVAIVLSSVALPIEKRYLIPMAILCALSIAGQQVMLIMTSVDRGRGRFGAYNLRRVVAAAAFPMLLMSAWFFTSVSLTMVGVLLLVASLISMAACTVDLPRPFRGVAEPDTKRLLREGRPYAFSMFATDIFERLDLFLILWIASLQDQGYYAAMVPVVYPLTVLPNTLGLFLFNAGADRQKTLSQWDVTRILGSSLAIQTACTVVFMLMIGLMIDWLYGSDFRPAVIFALWLAPVAAIKGILQGLDSYIKGRGRPLVAIRCRMVAMLLMIVMTWMLAEQHGAIAVAMSALAGQVLCLVWLSAIVYADVQHESQAGAPR